MRKSLSAIPVALLTLCAIGLTSCVNLDFNEGIGVVEVGLPHKATYSFASFKGTKTFKMSCSEDAGMTLEYSGKIEKGAITVSYKIGDDKVELYSLGEEKETSGTLQLETEGNFNVILEASEKCTNGSFRFEIKK